MASSVALISGKGGSGKTTLALSMASFLADCGLKVLLIDCDFSTNGATYFFEEKLREFENMRVFTAADMFPRYINADDYDEFFYESLIRDKLRSCLITINEFWDFIPSIAKIDKDYRNYIYITRKKTASKQLTVDYVFEFEQVYDVIIYDCQAGYSNALRDVIGRSSSCLAVMEADAISSSAIRSLFLKIGNELEPKKKKVYQVFNKVTSDEYDIYSKVSGGTVFTNIETILFDFKIRKAFAVAQIPDMKKTSIVYGQAINNICKTLFQSSYCQEKLSKYEKVLKLNEVEEKKQILQEKIHIIDIDQNLNRFTSLTLLQILGILLFVGYEYLFCRSGFFTSTGVVANIIFVALVEAMSVIPFLKRLNEQLTVRKEKEKCFKEIEKLNLTYDELNMELKFESDK